MGRPIIHIQVETGGDAAALGEKGVELGG